jgi:uncharacterized membrane protein (DUF4010 family)
METQELVLRLGLTLALGFVIGLERGWQERDEEEGHRAAGLRTFSLIGLLGGIFGALSLAGDRTFLSAGFVVVGASLAIFMWREGEHRHDFSATSFVAALLTFSLGVFAVLGDKTVAAGCGVAAVLLLANKKSLHGWLQRITWIELRSGLLLAAMTFIALPLLPNRAIDPWGALNPYELWLMTILIAAMSFAGYAAMKIAGPQRGTLLAAALGGLVASTAVTLSLARLARSNAAHEKMLAGGILAAGCVMMLRVLVISWLLNQALAVEIAPVLLVVTAVLTVIAILLVRSDGKSSTRKSRELVLKNPFELLEVLRFAALLALVLLAVVFARRYFGDSGLLGLAALSGLADVDAMTLSVARLGEVSPLAVNAILLTVAVNSVAKAAYATYAGGVKLGGLLLAITAAAIAVGLAVKLSLG